MFSTWQILESQLNCYAFYYFSGLLLPTATQYNDTGLTQTVQRSQKSKTKINVKGKFSDFGVGIQADGIIGTAVYFIASPVTTTIKRLVGKELPAGGKDVCAMPIGPENRSAKTPAGCK